MKLCNILVEGKTHLALETERGLVDATAAGCALTMDEVIAGADRAVLEAFAEDESLPLVEKPVYANVVNKTGKLVCVGLNYAEHARKTNMGMPTYPVLFSKFDNALVPAEAPVELPPWESTYDYEAELVVVMGNALYNGDEEAAKDAIGGYTCGNDLSARDCQFRSNQWLIGKSCPGFAPGGPWIVPAEQFDPRTPHRITCELNGVTVQDDDVTGMIFSCGAIAAYISEFMPLEPGDLIFTGTPAGVILGHPKGQRTWLKPGDEVAVTIEGIGTLRNKLV